MRNERIKIKSIISNNCWGGVIAHKSGMRFNAPTVNLFIAADDYIKFIRNLRVNLTKDIIFHEEESLNYGYPVGYIDDIKIHFMHYSSNEEALASWKRRSARLPESDDEILFEIADRDGFSEKTFRDFLHLPYKNKIGFVKRGRFQLEYGGVFFDIRTEEETCPPGTELADMTFDYINATYDLG